MEGSLALLRAEPLFPGGCLRRQRDPILERDRLPGMEGDSRRKTGENLTGELSLSLGAVAAGPSPFGNGL